MCATSNRERLIFSFVALDLIKEQMRHVASHGFLEAPQHHAESNFPPQPPQVQDYFPPQQELNHHIASQHQATVTSQQQQQQNPIQTFQRASAQSGKKTKGSKKGETYSLPEL